MVSETKQHTKCKFEIIMPPSEEKSFFEELTGNMDLIQDSFAKIDVENSQASVAAERLLFCSWFQTL